MKYAACHHCQKGPRADRTQGMWRFLSQSRRCDAPQESPEEQAKDLRASPAYTASTREEHNRKGAQRQEIQPAHLTESLNRVAEVCITADQEKGRGHMRAHIG